MFNLPGKDDDVTIVKIFIVIFNIILTILACVYYTLRWMFLSMKFLTWQIFKLFGYAGVILFIPIVVFVIVYFILSCFWDTGARPMFSIIQIGLNFVIELWNSIVRALRSFGVKLDTANGFGKEVPTFWEFLKYIVYILVWKPLEAGARGTLIR